MESFERGHTYAMTTTVPQSSYVVHKNDLSAIDPDILLPVQGNYCYCLEANDGQSIIMTEDIFGDIVDEFYIRFRYQLTGHYLNSAFFYPACVDDNNGGIQLEDYEGYIAVGGTINPKIITGSAIRPYKWYVIEFWMRYPQPDCNSNGPFELRIDGKVVASSDDADLCNSTYANYADRFVFTHGYTGTGKVQLIDDIVFDTTAAFDTTFTDSSIHWFTPNANGVNTDWTPSSGTNYQCVNENGTQQVANEQYVISNQIGDKDSYSLSTDSTGSIVNIKSIQTEHRVERVGRTNVRNVNPFLLINSSEYSGGEFPQTRPFVLQPEPIRTNWDTNPDTGSTWTESDIQNLELGIETES